ncbi:hypothetical protein NQ315_012118 [Exocentrus adspersus]|uniref:PHD-type domain-containing protein n=1 Tax=Exocentrus adspersus TaxID=1586481 RepID=A0AAV8VXX9_9CUCU|nr:hypothetical protein NQ315_012118 [Exocentrus adspersus]
MKFKNGVNKLTADELRSQPIGRDKAGHAYWFQSDENYQIRVYKEDLDEETWTLIAKDRESLVSLIDTLNDGDSKLLSSDSGANEDSNSLSEKPIIDTGQTDTDTKLSGEDNKDSNEEQEVTGPKEGQELNETSNLNEKKCDVESNGDDPADDNEHKTRPLLRIKNLTELIDNSKRFKPDCDEDSQDEVVKSKIRKLNEESVVDEAIEEPVMRIEGVGSGKENEGICLNRVVISNKQNGYGYNIISHTDPIVGDTVEENVMYFYGEGSGAECLTGNEQKRASGETCSNSKASPDDKSIQNSSPGSSITDSVSDSKDNNVKAKEVPRIKLGTIIDIKTDSSIIRLPSSSSKKSRWDVETVEDKSLKGIKNLEDTTTQVEAVSSKSEPIDAVSEDNIVEKKTPPTTPKKSTFFFGSGSLKPNAFSPSLTMGFGQNSPDKCISGLSNQVADEESKKCVTEDNEIKISKEDAITEEPLTTDPILEKKEHSSNENMSENNAENNEVIIKVSDETCSKTINNTVSSADSIDSCTDLIVDKNTEKTVDPSLNTITENEPKPYIEIQDEKDHVTESKTFDDQKENEPVVPTEMSDLREEPYKPVTEPKCVKKIAYICGVKVADAEPVHDPPTSESDQNKSVDIDNDNVKQQVDDVPSKISDALQEKCILQQSDESSNSGQVEITVSSQSVTQNEAVTADTVSLQSVAQIEAVTSEVNTNKELEDRGSSEKPVTQIEQETSDQKKPQIETTFVSTLDKTIQEDDPNSKTPEKPIDENPLDSGMNETKILEVSKTIDDKEKLIEKPVANHNISDNQTTSVSTDTSKLDEKDKSQVKVSGNVVSSDSSRPNSPVSVSESVIILPDSLESTVDYPLKDPLANSDEESPSPPPPIQKPMNLQSLSLDFNESSTPPPIPIIPSSRKLRKRGREASPEIQEVAASAGKKIKLKGKRQVDTKLRKSIEQMKQQQVSSSDEVLDISDDDKQSLKSRKKGKQVKSNRKEKVVEISDEDSGTPAPKPKKKHNKTSRLLANLGITDDKPFEMIGVRQSRRLAQLKIKEQAEGKKAESKLFKEEKSKKKKMEEKDPRKIFDEKKPWVSSSESSEIDEDVEEEEEVIEEDDLALDLKSDHEFSPESDLEDDGEPQPLKRARTARKNYEECDDEDDSGDDCPCEKCGKSDHPEWVLLCDNCDKGWHCSCLRPPLLVIPEGDWFCPPCQHVKLVENLQTKLTEYDKKLSKKEIEDRRKERLAYVGISLNNVLPSREHDHKKKRRPSTAQTDSSSDDSREQSSRSDSESDSDEPIYQLRQRRQAKSYKFNEYDDLIKSAIQDEIEEKGLEPVFQSRGKDIATIVNAEKEERKEKEEQQAKSEENEPEEKPPVVPEEQQQPQKEYSDDDVIKPVRKPRKKTRKINNLDVSSEEDDERDEDFKGTSSESEEEEEEFDEEEEDSEESDDYARGVNDDEEDDDVPSKKKKKKYWSETESEESDTSWGRKKKGRSGGRSGKKSKKKSSILDELSDLEPLKKKKPKIKYGGLTSSDEDTVKKRRTRGKKTTYVDTLGSDSEEDKRRNSRRIDSDEDDEDFIANEDEKDSDVQDDDLDEEDQDDELETVSGRRALVVPKIYIKKPAVTKEVDRPREKIPPSLQKSNGADVKNNSTKPDKSSLGLEQSQPVGGNYQSVNTSLMRRTIEQPITHPEQSLEKCSSVEDKLNTDHNKPLTQKRQNDVLIKSSGKGLINKELLEGEDDNPIEKINKNLEEMDSDDMEKMMEEEEFANQQLQLVAMQLEKEKKRKAEEAKRLELEEKSITPPVPAKRGRKPKAKELPKNIVHEPIVSNVKALIRNDVDNDELSEPPGVALPLFEELSSRKTEDEAPKRTTRGRGRGKKTLEETLANLGGRKNVTNKQQTENPSQAAGCNIEIAAPPQPFSQAAPTPSVITRMLQSKPGQNPAYPVGTIRPKQFATMPDDDDDSPNRSRGSSPSTGPLPLGGPPPGQFMPGGPRGPIGAPYRPMHPQGVSHFPRGPLPPPPVRPPGPPGPVPPHMYHPHRPLDPSPSGGGHINMSEPNPTQVPPLSSSPGSKMEPHNYSRTAILGWSPKKTVTVNHTEMNQEESLVA